MNEIVKHSLGLITLVWMCFLIKLVTLIPDVLVFIIGRLV